jgi:hypothetical protein
MRFMPKGSADHTILRQDFNEIFKAFLSNN